MSVQKSPAVTTFTMHIHFEWETSIGSHISSLEGAMKLKFVSFCSYLNALSGGIRFC